MINGQRTYRIYLKGFRRFDASSKHLCKLVSAPSATSLMLGLSKHSLDKVIFAGPELVGNVPMDDTDLVISHQGKVIMGDPVAMYAESAEFTRSK